TTTPRRRRRRPSTTSRFRSGLGRWLPTPIRTSGESARRGTFTARAPRRGAGGSRQLLLNGLRDEGHDRRSGIDTEEPRLSVKRLRDPCCELHPDHVLAFRHSTSLAPGWDVTRCPRVGSKDSHGLDPISPSMTLP